MSSSFSAGVEPGGLYSPEEIKILICYLLMGVGEPLPRQMVVEIIAGNGMANFFETSAAIDELLHQGHLAEPQPDQLQLSETGKQVAVSLSTRIPYTLRDRSVKSALQMLTRIRRERENRVTMEKLEEGGCLVRCAMLDDEKPLMEISLRVADHLQAELIRENFLNDPTLLYRSTLAILTGDAGMKRADTQIVIDLK